ncbi:MAG: DoxX family membrane protein [Minisyncoccota bacterium]
MQKLISSNVLLRVAIAFAFLYAGVDSFIDPNAWVSFFPSFALAIIPGTLLLPIWGVVEIIIALWILSGKHIFIPSLFAATALVAIVLFNISLMQIVFRDLALACVALALALQSLYPSVQSQNG